MNDRAPRTALRALLAGLVTVALLAGPAPAGPPASAATSVTAKPEARSHHVVAYYFHTTQRCASCRAIEAYAHEAIETGFAAELGDGRLEWKVVNLEVGDNAHFAKDFGLYTKSLVLVDEVAGKPAKWRNLEKVWQLLQDKPKFLEYVRGETRRFLDERS